MANRSTAAILNAVLWGSGYLYQRRGANGVFAILAHLILYFYTISSLSVIWFWIPILVFGSLFFAIDGYRPSATPSSPPSSKTADKNVCASCGATLPAKGKFCHECGAARERA